MVLSTITEYKIAVFLGVVEAAGSNPVTQTNTKPLYKLNEACKAVLVLSGKIADSAP